MSGSVAFFEEPLNITTLVSPDTSFMCSCGWYGAATELGTFNEYSCCPKCDNLDIRIDFEKAFSNERK